MNTYKDILALALHHNKELWYRCGFFNMHPAYDSKWVYRKNMSILFLSIRNDDELKRFFNFSSQQIYDLINCPRYNQFYISKKKKGKRKILSPEKELKVIQRKITNYLNCYYSNIKPEEIHGFVVNKNVDIRTCNIVNNAKPHIQKKWLLSIDIKDFFPSIKAKDIYNLFQSKLFCYNQNISVILSLLCTYEGILPTGSPCSPILSNFICWEMDHLLIEYCNQHNINYTRYADDLSFSSNDDYQEGFLMGIQKIIESYNFIINTSKLRLKRNISKQVVTGIVVNEKINVDRKLIRKVRAMLHDLTVNGKIEATRNHFNKNKIEKKDIIIFLNRLEGYINFIGQVRGKYDYIYYKYKSIFYLMTKNIQLPSPEVYFSNNN